MLIHLHSQATTTPEVRAAIPASDAPASVLVARYGTTGQTAPLPPSGSGDIWPAGRVAHLVPS